MEKRNLGKSNLEVSVIGFGGMSLSSTDLLQSISLIHKAYETGINYFDTADLYDRGANEELFGKALAAFRDKVILATKVGNAWQAGEDGWTWNPSKQHILKSVDASLRRLQTDYIDLYQLHGGTIEDNFEEIVETFERLKDTGKIREYGLSSIRPNVFLKYIQHAEPVTNMMQYSVLDTRPEEFLSGFEAANVAVIARGSLAQGFLLDKTISKPYLQHTLEHTTLIQQTLKNAAKELGVRKETLALKYVAANTAVASAIVGIRTLDHLEAVQTALDEWDKISNEEVKRLFSHLPKLQYQDHRT